MSFRMRLAPCALIAALLAASAQAANVDDPSMQEVIRAVLASGGNYAVAEDTQEGGDLAGAMLAGQEQRASSQARPADVSLPYGVRLFRLAKKDDAEGTPAFIYTARSSRNLRVWVGTDGGFVPAITVNSLGTQISPASNEYEVAFEAVAGRVYTIRLNEPPGSEGLYSIAIRK